jgi:SAM-dependent methyltransferase
MAEVASSRLDHVFCGTADAFFAAPGFASKLYDVIVMADVLEHMEDPWTILRQARHRLNDGGSIIISLPNIRHIDTIFNLVVRGVWPYRDRGIHDRTHLRFFTWANIEDLLRRAGLECAEVSPNYRLLERPDRINRHAKWVRYLPVARSFFVFQYVLRARLTN